MAILQIRLKNYKRKLNHVKYLNTTLWDLKYSILNDALSYQINKQKINLFHKYQKRLKLITFLK